MASTSKIGKTATTISTNDKGVTRVTYHSTDVVTFNDCWILLDTGGWKTATTKSRMNQTANQMELNFNVYQEKGTWIVWTWKRDQIKGETIRSDSKEMPTDLMLINRKSGRLYPSPTTKRMNMTGLI